MFYLILSYLLLIGIRVSSSNIYLGNITDSTVTSIRNSTDEPEETTIPSKIKQPKDLSFTDTDESNNVSCNNTLNNNATFLNLQDLTEGITEELSVLARTNDTLNELLVSFENASQLFVNELDGDVGEWAIKLGRNYLENSTKFLEGARNVNVFINEYYCRNETKDEYFNIIPIMDYENNFKNSLFIQKQFQYIFNITMLYTDVYYDNEKVAAAIEKHNSLRDLGYLSSAITEIKNVNKKLQVIIQKLKEFYSFLGDTEIYPPFKTEFVSDLIDLDYWQNMLSNKTYEVEDHEKYFHTESFRIIIQERIQPVFQGIIFIVGFIGNVILLIIFAKHKEMRTIPSMIILNLAFCDSINLLLNIPTFYSYSVSSKWEYGVGACILFRFSRQLGIAVSIYSVVMISIQRYLAFANLFKTHKCSFTVSTRLTSFLSILLVWIIGAGIGGVHSINAGVYKNHCYASSEDQINFSKFISSFDFVVFCIIPITSITVLSIATARIIKASISDMPGESIGMDKHIKTRIISSRVLISLAVFSALSYLPYYGFMFVYSFVDYVLDPSSYQVLFFIFYTLSFANCCFNPIALYIFSGNFRKYFNKYLFCKTIESRDDSQKQSSTGTTTSSLETRL
ncbi:hypothetical protein C0J52_28495 [Blattella germanica]|nr:hypothetical protein C0J52_28495 [Blattella germanica]